MANDKRNDPFITPNFSVDVDDIHTAGFSEVSGLNVEMKPVDYREGTDRQGNVRKLAGQPSYGPVKLIRGYTKNNEFWQWYANILNGQPDRRNVTITLMNEAREPQMSWHLQGALITGIQAPAFKASGNEVAMETVDLVHEGLTLEIL
jgi:phage tail-like protein